MALFPVSNDNDKYVIDNYTIPAEETGASRAFSYAYRPTKTGYTPVGILGWQFERSHAILYDGVEISNGQVIYYGYNVSTASQTTGNGRVTILWQKS